MTTTRGTDLDKRSLKILLELIENYYVCIIASKGRVPDEIQIYRKEKQSKLANKERRQQHFVDTLKNALDLAFKPDWHVIFGEDVGFALKYRRKTLGMFRVGPSEQDRKYTIVVYKSPAVEVLSQDSVHKTQLNILQRGPASLGAGGLPTSTAELDADGATQVDRNSEDDVQGDTPNLFSDQGLVVLDSTSSTEMRFRMLQVIAQCFVLDFTPDSQEFSSTLRRRLTDRIGPIWHVFVGRSFAVSTVKRGKCLRSVVEKKEIRAICFQHSQAVSNWLRKTVSVLPFVVGSIICLFVIVRSKLCDESRDSSSGSPFIVETLVHTLCSEVKSQSVLYTLLIVFISSTLMTFLSKKMNSNF